MYCKRNKENQKAEGILEVKQILIIGKMLVSAKKNIKFYLHWWFCDE